MTTDFTEEQIAAVHKEISATIPPGTWQGDWDGVWNQAAVRLILQARATVQQLNDIWNSNQEQLNMAYADASTLRAEREALASDVDGFETQATFLKKDVARLDAEVIHWKANHDECVKRCALLSQRPDLPADRLPAYDALTKERDEALARVRELESEPLHHGVDCTYKQLHDLFLSLPSDDQGYVTTEAAMRAMTDRIVVIEKERDEALARVRELEEFGDARAEAFDKVHARIALLEAALTHLKEEARKDFSGMLDMQAKYIAADRERIKLTESLKIAGVWDKPMARAGENERLRVAFEPWLCAGGKLESYHPQLQGLVHELRAAMEDKNE